MSVLYKLPCVGCFVTATTKTMSIPNPLKMQSLVGSSHHWKIKVFTSDKLKRYFAAVAPQQALDPCHLAWHEQASVLPPVAPAILDGWI